MSEENENTNSKRYMQPNVHSSILFTTAKIWRQPKCLPMDEWIKNMWYTYTMEYYSAIKKNEILPFVTTWMEGVRLRVVSQKEKDNICYHLYVESKNKTN